MVMTPGYIDAGTSIDYGNDTWVQRCKILCDIKTGSAQNKIWLGKYLITVPYGQDTIASIEYERIKIDKTQCCLKCILPRHTAKTR